MEEVPEDGGQPEAMAVETCYPSGASTVYGYLPAFPTPTAVGNTKKYDAAYWYAANGNITTLNRNNDLAVKTAQQYSYGSALSNRLTSASFAVGTGTAMPYSYTYDANGNLLTDVRNTVSAIGYSAFTDLPVQITNSSGAHKYRYDGGQQRSVKEITSTDREYYLDGVILSQDGKVKSYQTAEGYCVPNATGSSVTYYYNVKDWLGSTRVVLSGTGTVQNAVDYYPYGKKLPGRSNFLTSAEGYRYQFTGHETDGETSYQYHGARYYSDELGKYMSVDPWAAKYAGWSTYAYGLGNPVRFVDPSGRGAEDWVKPAGSNSWQFDANLHIKEEHIVMLDGTEYAKAGYIYPAQGGGNFQLGTTATNGRYVNETAKEEPENSATTMDQLRANNRAATRFFESTGSSFTGKANAVMGGFGIAALSKFDVFNPYTWMRSMDATLNNGVTVAGLMRKNDMGFFKAYFVNMLVQEANTVQNYDLQDWSEVISSKSMDVAGGYYAGVGIFGKAGVGMGAAESGGNVLSPGELLRIENAATRINKPITVVGSRATGTAGAYSDWDYVIPRLNSRNWSTIKNSLPGSRSVFDNTPRNIDIFKGPLDQTKPHIIINPRP